MSTLLIPRASWPEAFPDVVLHADLSERNAHCDYWAAKSGHSESAYRLTQELISTVAIETIRQLLADQTALLAPVTAIEMMGINAIPDSMAVLLSQALSLPIESGNIVQINKVGHTRAKGWHRTVTPALFAGEVISGANYILVDDHVGHGGTLANIRGYIEANGGRVLLMTTLTETRQARTIAIQKTTLDMLHSKHGKPLEQFWIDTFGYGYDCLTDIEGGYLARQPTLDGIRTALATAVQEAGARGLSTIQSP